MTRLRVPVDARRSDWPRLVANAINQIHNDVTASGTVTSVALTVPTGLSVAGSPITSSGTLAVTFSAGYAIPTTAKQTDWDTAFGWGNHATAGYLTTAAAAAAYQPLDTQLTDLSGLSYGGNALKVVRVNAGATGFELATISGGSLSDGDYGDITVGGGGTTLTIDNSAVTLAKMADVATGSLFYRKTAGSGAPEVQTLATLKTDLGLTGTNSGDQTITLTGDVTGTGTGSFAATIASDAVTYAKMQNVSAASKLLGRGSASGSGDVEEITAGLGLEVNATTLRIASGTSFPGSPATGDLFYRTDRKIEYFYDGTRWLSVALHSCGMSLTGLVISVSTNYHVPHPQAGDYDLYVEKLNFSFFQASGTTAANYYTLQLVYGNTPVNLGGTTSSQGSTLSTWTKTQVTINAVLPSTAATVYFSMTETGTATILAVAGFTYRLVG